MTQFAPAWLADQCDRLLRFGAGARHPEGGFGWLDDAGRLDRTHPVELWINCRMTHVFGLASMLGDPGAPALLDHGVAALTGRLRDGEHGGWFAAVDETGPVRTAKEAYAHAFVLLAASTATAAGHRDGPALLDEAVTTFDRRFWRADDGMAVDVWNRDWTELEAYRGANANMHTVEALLAVHDVTGDPVHRTRAAGVVERIVHGVAREHGWLLPEHFDEQWTVLLDYNRDRPADPFRPYGATIGHLLEWARLTLHVRTALGDSAPGWMLDDARALFEVAVRTGWDVDGAQGSGLHDRLRRPARRPRPAALGGRRGAGRRVHPGHGDRRAGLRGLARAAVGARERLLHRSRARLLAPRAGPAEPPGRHGLARQARHLPRLPGHAAARARRDHLVRRGCTSGSRLRPDRIATRSRSSVGVTAAAGTVRSGPA